MPHSSISHLTILVLTYCVGVFAGGSHYVGAGGSYGGGPVGGNYGGQAIGGYSGGQGVSQAIDFNPLLLQGSQRGYPGIRARINSRAFQYASGMVGDLLNSEIKKARIPPITQCVPQVQGCIQIYNLYVSRYRCPQRVVLYPAAPNRVVLQVQNVDIGVTGNLGGQIVVLLPIALTGIVQLNIHQATITVDMAIERGPHGPYVRVLSCNVHIGYADAYIENGGLIGDIVNSQFRSRISNMVKEMIPGQVCGQIPSIVNEKLNSRLAGLPQTIGVAQMISMFGGALGLGANGASSAPSAQYCQANCKAPTATVSASSSQVSAPAPSIPQAPVQQVHQQQQVLAPAPSGPVAAPAPQIPTEAYVPGRHKAAARTVTLQQYQTNQNPDVRSLAPIRQPTAAVVRTYRTVTYQQNGERRTYYVPVARAKRQAAQQRIIQQGVQQFAQGAQPQFARVVRHNSGFAPQAAYGQKPNYAQPRFPPPPPVYPPVQPNFPPAPINACSKCPAAGAPEDPATFIRQLATHLDMSKLNDLYLGVQLLNTYATSNDFTVDLTGEFSPQGQGGTPFGPFPTQFPGAYDNHMAEFIVSDYTINTLFYWMHRKQFLTFRIGPDTPKIGELLKTTCSEDEDELESTDVELDAEESKRLRRSRAYAAQTRKFVEAIKLNRHRRQLKRGRRQDDAAGLADLGICFGDILPAVREKYPNQKIAIQIRTVRAPSIILSQARGGTATLDMVADADIYIDGTNNKVGTITIAATVVIIAQVRGNRISGSTEITNLKLTDRTGSLGLPQDALDNLGNLGKELLQKLANDALGKGVQVNIPSSGLGGLPINIINPEFRIVEHGLYIATDITVSPSLLGVTGGC